MFILHNFIFSKLNYDWINQLMSPTCRPKYPNKTGVFLCHLRKTNVFEVYQNTFHYAQLMRDYREQTCVIIVSYVQISECSYLILFTLIEVTFHCRSFHCLLHCPLAVILELWKTDACLVANCPNNRINTPTLTFLVFSRNKQRNQVNM